MSSNILPILWRDDFEICAKEYFPDMSLATIVDSNNGNQLIYSNESTWLLYHGYAMCRYENIIQYVEHINAQ